MIAIVDYGVGNVFSLQSSLHVLGLQSSVTQNPRTIEAAPHVILPGVGAFADAMEKLTSTGLCAPVLSAAAKGTPLLGICLGMQLLFEESFEFGRHKGLGLIKGQICPLAEDLQQDYSHLKVPHMGWNPLHIVNPSSPIVKNTRQGEFLYYVHSFYAKNCDDSLVATSEYGVAIPGLVQNGNVFGAQFHPEKSGQTGLALLQAFAEI